MSARLNPSNRSLSYPSNLESHSSRISLSDLTSSPLPTFTTSSPRIDCDNSTQTIFITMSQFENSYIDTPEEFQYSEPSPSTFSQPLFQSLTCQLPNEPSPAPSSYTDATPILSPMTSDQPDPPNPFTDEQENELDNFITLQQQLQITNTLRTHQLSRSLSNSESSNQSSNAVETRAHRVFNRKFSNAQSQLFRHPRPARLFSLHPLHTNTIEFLKYNLPFFPHNTYYQITNNDQLNFVDEYSLFPTLSWT